MNSPSFKHTLELDAMSEDNHVQPEKDQGDDMNMIKAYIGNLLYEKWFIENFTKNTEQLERLPPSKLSRFSF